jgi:fido (protein-threonine AMPylation protein)
LTRFEDVDRVLSEGEVRGREWIHASARVIVSPQPTPTVEEIFELHGVMFAPIFDWAGAPRVQACGPGGVEHVSWLNVREELYKLAGDVSSWVSHMVDTDLSSIARVVADFHHRFQWIHPLPDTNGRTGRVLDHLLLWRTFDLVGESLVYSPMIEHFPDEAHEAEYYGGLTDADHHRPERLRNYYVERIGSAIDALVRG